MGGYSCRIVRIGGNGLVHLEVKPGAYTQREMSIAKQLPGIVDGDRHYQGLGHFLYQHLQPLGLEFLGGPGSAAGAFGKEDGPSARIDAILPDANDLFKGVAALGSIDRYHPQQRQPPSEEGYPVQFFLVDEAELPRHVGGEEQSFPR